MKKVLALALSLALIATLAISGTIAYLTDEEEQVNVMTLGKVDIEQLEYERVVDENGEWVPTAETDKYGYTPDELQAFEQNKPLYPAVFQDGDIKWDDRENGTHQQSWGQVGASGSNQLFDDSVKNAQDKFVFVKNTGKSDAYVRTLVAFEQGSIAAENFEKVIMTNRNKSHWDWSDYMYNVEIDGNVYAVRSITYKGAASSGSNGILAPGAVSYPSLLQVYMKPEATNDDVEAIDGNNNGTYDILVLSQAVQTNGFADAKSALNTAFGAVTAENIAEWFEGIEIPASVSTAAELKTALEAGKEVILTKDIDLGNEQITVTGDATLNLAGHDLTGAYTGTDHYAMFNIKDGASLTVSGNGEVSVNTAAAENNRSLAIFLNSGDLTINGGSYKVTDATEGKTWIIATIVDNRTTNNTCTTSLTINGGEFAVEGKAINLFRNYPQQGGSATLTINDGTFKANSTADTTYIWNQEAGSYLGELYFNGGTYDAKVVYEDYNGQSDVHIADGVTIQGAPANT